MRGKQAGYSGASDVFVMVRLNGMNAVPKKSQGEQKPRLLVRRAGDRGVKLGRVDGPTLGTLRMRGELQYRKVSF